jgi:hypothetical protein
MDLTDAKAFITLVAAEYKRRADLLPEDDDGTGYAYDQWMFTDLPFLHDLCILYLVAVRHHIERRLLFFATCATGHGNKIKRADFERAQRSLLALPQGKRWKEIARRLKPTQCARYSSVEALRLLANSYKHDPRLQPDMDLVRHLGLDEKLIYAPLPESFELKRGLARIVGLPDDSRFAEITQKFVEHADEFLKDVQAKNVLSPVNWGRVSLTEFAH